MIDRLDKFISNLHPVFQVLLVILAFLTIGMLLVALPVILGFVYVIFLMVMTVLWSGVMIAFLWLMSTFGEFIHWIR